MDNGELILLDNVIADAPWVEGGQNTSFGRTFMWMSNEQKHVAHLTSLSYVILYRSFKVILEGGFLL